MRTGISKLISRRETTLVYLVLVPTLSVYESISGSHFKVCCSGLRNLLTKTPCVLIFSSKFDTKKPCFITQPVDEIWSDWGSWSMCFDHGMTRHRSCGPVGKSLLCQGDNSQKNKCNFSSYTNNEDVQSSLMAINSSIGSGSHVSSGAVMKTLHNDTGNIIT